MSGTARAQRAAIARDLEREMRGRDRARIRELRDAIKAARARKREALKRVRQGCAARRQELREKAQRLREELTRTIREEREAARNQCSASRERAREEADRQIAARGAELARERADQRLIHGTAKRASKPKITARERAQESDDEVRRNIPHELIPLFDKVRRAIKASPRRSRTEAFLEWVHDHPEAVWELHETQEAAELARLEREERELARDLKRNRYGRRAREIAAAEVPF